MDQLSPEQVQEAFRLLGLETEQARAEFTRFAYPPRSEDQPEYLRLDSTSKPPEATSHAELA